MRIIPVLDLLNGVTVQAVAGRRNDYRPVRSCLTDSVDPSLVIKSLNEVCGSETAYVADLDAILNREPNRCTLAELSRMNLNLLVDAGIRSCEDVQDLLDLGIENVVVDGVVVPVLDAAAKWPTQTGCEDIHARFDETTCHQ